jgi:Domain of unknown function (DUF4402)
MNGAKNLNRRKSLLALAALNVAIGAASPHATAKTSPARAVVVKPLSFVKIDNLDFGQIIPSNGQSLVTLSPSSLRTKTGNIVLVGSKHKAAAFAGFGTQNQTITISIGANQIFITGPGAQMRVDQWRIGSTPATALTSNPQAFFIGSTTGAFQFTVGARLRVNSNQAPGNYTGNWIINLNYQ